MADVYYRQEHYSGPRDPSVPEWATIYNIYLRNNNKDYAYYPWDGSTSICEYCYVYLELVDGKFELPYDSSALFQGCLNETIENLDKVDASECEAFLRTFCGCPNLKSLDLSSFGMNEAKNLRGMCEDCPNLEYVNVSGWNVSKVWGFQRVFNNCPKLSYIQASPDTDWDRDMDHSGYSESDDIFAGCVSLPGYDENENGIGRANTAPGEWDYEYQYWRSYPGFFTGEPMWYEFEAYEKVDGQWEPIEMRTWYQQSEYLNPKWAETVIYNKGSWK